MRFLAIMQLQSSVTQCTVCANQQWNRKTSIEYLVSLDPADVQLLRSALRGILVISL